VGGGEEVGGGRENGGAEDVHSGGRMKMRRRRLGMAKILD
jgi:hypothetical protein